MRKVINSVISTVRSMFDTTPDWPCSRVQDRRVSNNFDVYMYDTYREDIARGNHPRYPF